MTQQKTRKHQNKMMSPSAFLCLKINEYISLLLVANFLSSCHAWLPDTHTKLVNNANRIPSISFRGNNSFLDHFTVLYQDENTILLGGRNWVYNLSVFDFTERRTSGLYWPSSEPHSQLCLLKGKTEDDCQNYIRLLFYTDQQANKMLVCGTNSYKPLCRYYAYKNGEYVTEKEVEGIGLCPYDPEHNSTAIFSNGHLFSATVADFSGGDPLIYREPLSTELSDLKQLNAPNFVSSLSYGDYIYFFYREPAVEYMNCGKVIYSRVARVCKDDKGGPHQSRDKKWTTFTKARLNCSMPGEYPFYFDEIQSTSNIIEGTYGEMTSKIVYSALTTPDNAIGGSAICIFQMGDIENVFKGPFKHQDGINSNWLPVPENKVPVPRPGECVRDSRILPDQNVNFIKTHPLMEKAVPSMHGRPILIRVSLHYRFTAIAVDPQVRTVTDETYDVIYVGTDDGKILKIVNIPNERSARAVVISENEIFARDTPIKQLRTAPGHGKVIVVSKGEVKLVTINHCNSASRCSECVELRDPHCAWDPIKSACVSIDVVTSFRYLIQDVRKGNGSKCKVQQQTEYTEETNNVATNAVNEDSGTNSADSSLKTDIESMDCNDVDSEIRTGCSRRQEEKKIEYTSETFHIIVVIAALVGLFVGFFCGYLVSRRFHVPSQYPNFIEQHNHLERVSVNQNSFLAKPNKTVNLDVLNVSTDSLPPKKDNLGSLKNLNITSEGTLQKIKKTYI